METDTEMRVNDWASAATCVEAAVYTFAMQLNQESKNQQADYLLASWARLKRGQNGATNVPTSPGGPKSAAASQSQTEAVGTAGRSFRSERKDQGGTSEVCYRQNACIRIFERCTVI